MRAILGGFSGEGGSLAGWLDGPASALLEPDGGEVAAPQQRLHHVVRALSDHTNI